MSLVTFCYLIVTSDYTTEFLSSLAVHPSLKPIKMKLTY